MSKLDKISLFISFIGLWMNSYLNDKWQLIIGFIFIFLIGILHGSNDILLINKTVLKKSLTNTKIIAYYVAVVLLGTLLFCYVPVIGLLLFIIVSSYHFGEQHWQFLKNKRFLIPIVIFQFIYGFNILVILFQSHEVKVKTIISSITNYSISNLNFNYILFATMGLLLLFGFLLYKNLEIFREKLIINIFYLIVFTVIFKTANLIWAFAIYFVIWHSLPSIRDQINFMHGSINIENIKKYIITAFPFWIISLFGILILYVILKDEIIFESIFFSFLAAITFPHVYIIIKMFIKQKTE
ncbi:Brp/Blh family beta-carotene 15,15'-dioxygenase [Flavobacterium sp.]|uniref:Brp/Blh family beta-carotene 15,15'-dioxygenase n=1 Tax=Flavobacterium sp. TaxID=239 RepID=UPI003F6973DA